MESTDEHPIFSAEVYVAEIEGKKAHSLRSFYPRIAKALFFPDYFGKNLDALFDCLCSLEVLGKKEVVLLIRDADQLLDKEKPEKRAALMQVLQDSEKPENRVDGVDFRVVLLR